MMAKTGNLKNFKTTSPAGRIVGSGFTRSVKSIDAVLYSGFGGYKMKKEARK